MAVAAKMPTTELMALLAPGRLDEGDTAQRRDVGVAATVRVDERQRRPVGSDERIATTRYSADFSSMELPYRVWMHRLWVVT